jgi:cation transport ATPase
VLHKRIESAEANRWTVIVVGRENHSLGFVGVADAPRQSSREALHALKGADAKAQLVMMSGDSPAVA